MSPAPGEAFGCHLVSFHASRCARTGTERGMADGLAQRGYLLSRVPATLYAVRERSQPPAPFVARAWEHGAAAVNFEMALI